MTMSEITCYRCGDACETKLDEGYLLIRCVDCDSIWSPENAWRRDEESYYRYNSTGQYIARLRSELKAAKEEIATLAFAAHMPDDYRFGLPSWINQRLYACYVGASISPIIQDEIEKGTLSFPDAPVWKENARLRAELEAVKAERDLPRVADNPQPDYYGKLQDYSMWQDSVIGGLHAELAVARQWSAAWKRSAGMWRRLTTGYHERHHVYYVARRAPGNVTPATVEGATK